MKSADVILGTGFWCGNFGEVSMYFKRDVLLADIDTSDEAKEHVEEVAVRAIDRFFQAIEEARK